MSEDDKCAFADVKKSGATSLYPDNYVAAAARENIVTGYPGSYGPVFKPDASITLAQMVTMGTRAANGRCTCRPIPTSRPGAASTPRTPSSPGWPSTTGCCANWRPPGRRSTLCRPGAPPPGAQAAALLFNIMGTDTAGLNGRFLGDSSDLVRYFREHDRGNDGKFTRAAGGLWRSCT